MNYLVVLSRFKNDTLFWVRLAAFLAFSIPFIMEPQVWFSERLFPLIPLFDSLPVPSLAGDIALMIVFFLAFLAFVLKPHWIYGLPVVGIYVFWALLDQNRIQPFYFEIIVMVLALTQFKERPVVAKQCVLLILVGTYFWSGIHKYNAHFFEFWSNGLAKKIPFVPYWMRQLFTYAVPFLEASFGLMLIFPKTRKWGIWLLTCMHAMILGTFAIGGFGYLVFPLTLFNIFTLFYLFYNKPFKTKAVFVLNTPKSLLFFCVAIILPLFNFWGFYDHLLAFSYFSAKPKYCRLYFSQEKDTNRLPANIKQLVREYNGEYYIDFNEWSGNTIRVMVYPEDRVYNKIQNHINTYLETPNTRLEYY